MNWKSTSIEKKPRMRREEYIRVQRWRIINLLLTIDVHFLGWQADFNLSEYSRKGQRNKRTKLSGIVSFITYGNYLANSTTRGSCGRDLSLPTTAGETMVFICHTISLSFDGEILNASIRRDKTTSEEVTFRSAARLRFMDINSLISSWENLKPLWE